MTRVNSPRVRIVAGRVRKMRIGRRNALRSPSTRAATNTVGQLSTVTPETMWMTTRSAVLLTTHLTMRSFIPSSAGSVAERLMVKQRSGPMHKHITPARKGDTSEKRLTGTRSSRSGQHRDEYFLVHCVVQKEITLVEGIHGFNERASDGILDREPSGAGP